MIFLYSLVDTPESDRAALYIKKGKSLDFMTYFNAFSVGKWRRYSTLVSLQLELHLAGRFAIEFVLVTKRGRRVLDREETRAGTYTRSFSVDTLEDGIMGFVLTPLEEESRFLDGAYYGEFAHSSECRIGVAVCTFRREKYVRRTMEVLRRLTGLYSWLEVLIVDNGATLELQEERQFRVIHNPNYGGSGGFTRGIIEHLGKKNVDYVLLMDDDIRLEAGVLERTHALLLGLKEEYRDSFLAGAMLSLENPLIQFENTAYWDVVRYRPLFQNMDLSQVKNLAANGETERRANQYGGWWYCCIPVRRIRAIGYPLPVFVRGDDIEYGIRNDREILLMNGIGVWHGTLESKFSLTGKYYSTRNSFILNHYLQGGSRISLLLSMAAQLGYRGLVLRGRGLKVVACALRDYCDGFEKLTAIPADEKMREIQMELDAPLALKDVFVILQSFFSVLFCYRRLQEGYKGFRSERLASDTFWRRYLGLDGK